VPKILDFKAFVLPPPELHLKQFTVAEYDQMIRTGSLQNQRVELLDGWIVEKMSTNPPHESSILRLTRRLMRILGDEYLVRVQCSIETDLSMPEPDLAIVHGNEDEFDDRRPNAEEVQIVIEVSDSSHIQDQGFKHRLYARNKIPVYWIVNLQDCIIEAYEQPRGGRNPTYRTRADYAAGSSVPVVIRKKTIGHILVNEILP
jgi:Uma2 family endonuclease